MAQKIRWVNRLRISQGGFKSPSPFFVLAHGQASHLSNSRQTSSIRCRKFSPFFVGRYNLCFPFLVIVRNPCSASSERYLFSKSKLIFAPYNICVRLDSPSLRMSAIISKYDLLDITPTSNSLFVGRMLLARFQLRHHTGGGRFN